MSSGERNGNGVEEQESEGSTVSSVSPISSSSCRSRRTVWVNYKISHSDFNDYGDLDSRFVHIDNSGVSSKSKDEGDTYEKKSQKEERVAWTEQGVGEGEEVAEGNMSEDNFHHKPDSVVNESDSLVFKKGVVLKYSCSPIHDRFFSVFPSTVESR